MIGRVKRALVETYIGALALGWILSQCVTHLVGIVSSPVARWLMRRQYAGFPNQPAMAPRVNFEDAVPDLISLVLLLLVFFILLRWLYLEQASAAEENYSHLRG